MLARKYLECILMQKSGPIPNQIAGILVFELPHILPLKAMKTAILLLMLLPVMGCKKDQPTPMAFDDFSFVAPANWKKFEAQGYDSKVGGITDGKDTLRYDMGMYSYSVTKETSATHHRTETMQHGYKTLTVWPKKTGNGLMGIYIKVDDFRKLSIYGVSKNEDEVLGILASVKVL